MEYYVNTKTQEEYDELMDILDKQGKKWYNGKTLNNFNAWLGYGKNTVINTNSATLFGNKVVYLEEGKTIISLEEYKQILNSEIPKIAEQTEETFTRGELVEVSSDNNYWYKRIFLVEIKRASIPYICVYVGNTEYFDKGEKFSTCCWQFIRKIPKAIEIDGKKFSLKQVKEAIKDLKPIE